MTTGAKLKPDDKPSEHGCMHRPICKSKGFNSDHLKRFHSQLMQKVVSKKRDKAEKKEKTVAPENSCPWLLSRAIERGG